MFDIDFDSGYGRVCSNVPRDRICSVIEQSYPGRGLVAGQRVMSAEFGHATFVAENEDGTYRVQMRGEQEVCDVEAEFVRLSGGLCFLVSPAASDLPCPEPEP